MPPARDRSPSGMVSSESAAAPERLRAGQTPSRNGAVSNGHVANNGAAKDNSTVPAAVPSHLSDTELQQCRFIICVVAATSGYA